VIGYTFGAAGMLLALIGVLLVVAIVNKTTSNYGAANAGKYGAVTIAIIFAVAAVLMLVIGQAWLWEPRG
jgi:hypothetical protein